MRSVRTNVLVACLVTLITAALALPVSARIVHWARAREHGRLGPQPRRREVGRS
ncbi:MAG: hypothetical protein ABIG03_01315 [Candidatus Eisenbacteria bacterium]